MVRIARLQIGRSSPSSAGALSSWAQEVRLRTSVDIAQRATSVRPEDPNLFRYPLLYWGGNAAPARISDQGVAALRQHLSTGGVLIIDDTSRSGPSSDFDVGVRAQVERILSRPLEPVPDTHVVYRSFYRLTRPYGRRADAHNLEGVRLGKHYAVLYTRNDLAGAFKRAATGGYALPVVPGGEMQREQAFRLAINLVLYALCFDYKDDHTHIMHLLRRRRLKGLPPPSSRNGR